MALVPQVVDAVGIPVVAAGGIASGRQVLPQQGKFEKLGQPAGLVRRAPQRDMRV